MLLGHFLQVCSFVLSSSTVQPGNMCSSIRNTIDQVLDAKKGENQHTKTQKFRLCFD